MNPSHSIEDALASLAGAVDLAAEVFDDQVLDVVTAREAWQYRVLPLRYEDGVLLCASAIDRVDDAVLFIRERCTCDVRFVLVETVQLEQKIMQRYPNA